MKTSRFLIVLACFVTFIIPLLSHADDTAVYDINQDVKPNVLIIFDNSTSMTDGVPYDDGIVPPYSGSYDPLKIYERTCIDQRWWGCARYGWVESSMTLATFEAGDTNEDGIYDSNSRIRKGNRLNYENSSPGVKLAVAKTATKQIINDTYASVRLGVMLLNGTLNRSNNGYHTDNTILSTTIGGSEIQQWDDAGGATDKDILNGYIDLISAGSYSGPVHYTPLANRLIAAAQYFKHEDNDTLPAHYAWGNFGEDGDFADPIDAAHWCRKNYVILVTDGLPTAEGNSKGSGDDEEGDFDYIEAFLPYRADVPAARGHYNYDYNATTNNTDTDPNCPLYASIPGSGGTDYLDDVAKYLYDTDLRPETAIPGTQNITTFVIGFALTDSDTLLGQTAFNGGGEYKTAANAAQLEDALTNIMATIIERAQTFTAPVVPVQRSTSGDKMYISLFTPKTAENFWPGYLVKLKIGDDGELIGFSGGYGSGDEVQVTDSNGTLHENLLSPNLPPYPYWDAQRALIVRSSSRDIYTHLGTADLNNSSNEFNDTNITESMLASPAKRPGTATGTTAKQDLINYIYGYDAYDKNKNGTFTEKREYILGDILHSKPLIIDYASDLANPQRVIYVGTNDGMLHAFRDTDGLELWAFIPPDLLPKLKNMVEGTGHQYYVDGSPQAYILDSDRDGNIETPDSDGNFDKVIIIFGERRGGISYCALDVTNPDDPQYLWRIDNAMTDFGEMGQSWSDPIIGKVKSGPVNSETDTTVAIIGGGYSEDNSAGRALYLINVLDGSLVKSFTSLTKSIPSTVLAVDTNFDGYINRVYVGDLGGQMWRFGLQRTGSGDTRAEDGNVNNWTARRLFYESTLPNPKIFYPPDMVLEPGSAYLYFGTGDREEPMDMTETNRFYALRDKNVIGSYTTLVETNLVNLTGDPLQDPGVLEADKQIIRSQLATGNGWYMTLNTAEKVLAPPTVIAGLLLFTSFTPVNPLINPCSYGGNARLYAVDYLTAVSLLDLDGDGDVDKADQSKEIGQGIPTEVVITITETGETRGYIGAGGGIIKFDLTGEVSRFNIDAWREEF